MENECKDNCRCYSNLRIYENFEPTSELDPGKDYDTLRLHLPGFNKEEIKIELCKTGILKISGQRLLTFQKDILVPTNCDKSQIDAKLLNGILCVKHPKHITSSQKNENENESPHSSTKNEAKQDNKKEELDDELNKHDNAKQEQPKNHEQTQVVTRDESKKDATMRSISGFIAKLKMSSKVMNIALATLLVLGVGGYVVKVMRSSKKAKE